MPPQVARRASAATMAAPNPSPPPPTTTATTTASSRAAVRPAPVPSLGPAVTAAAEEKLGAHGGKVKHKRRFCRTEGCERIVKSQGLCQRHGAKPRLCKVEGCKKQAQGNFDGMCKSHFKEHKRKTTPIPAVNVSPNAVPVIEGSSVYDAILPSSVDFFPSFASKGRMPLVAHLAEGFHGGKPPAWHRNEERKARGLLPIQNPATQLEGWERELVWMEILMLTGVPDVSFRHLARAWGRDKGFHMVLAQFICERHGDVQRKKRKRDAELAAETAAASSTEATAAESAEFAPSENTAKRFAMASTAAQEKPTSGKEQQQEQQQQQEKLRKRLGVSQEELKEFRAALLTPERKKKIATLLRRRNADNEQPTPESIEEQIALIGADVWDDACYGDANYNEALAADLFNLTTEESAILMRRLSSAGRQGADDDSSSAHSRSAASSIKHMLPPSVVGGKDAPGQHRGIPKRDSRASLMSNTSNNNTAQIPNTVAVRKTADMEGTDSLGPPMDEPQKSQSFPSPSSQPHQHQHSGHSEQVGANNAQNNYTQVHLYEQQQNQPQHQQALTHGNQLEHVYQQREQRFVEHDVASQQNLSRVHPVQQTQQHQFAFPSHQGQNQQQISSHIQQNEAQNQLQQPQHHQYDQQIQPQYVVPTGQSDFATQILPSGHPGQSSHQVPQQQHAQPVTNELGRHNTLMPQGGTLLQADHHGHHQRQLSEQGHSLSAPPHQTASQPAQHIMEVNHQIGVPGHHQRQHSQQGHPLLVAQTVNHGQEGSHGSAHGGHLRQHSQQGHSMLVVNDVPMEQVAHALVHGHHRRQDSQGHPLIQNAHTQPSQHHRQLSNQGQPLTNHQGQELPHNDGQPQTQSLHQRQHSIQGFQLHGQPHHQQQHGQVPVPLLHHGAPQQSLHNRQHSQQGNPLHGLPQTLMFQQQSHAAAPMQHTGQHQSHNMDKRQHSGLGHPVQPFTHPQSIQGQQQQQQLISPPLSANGNAPSNPSSFPHAHYGQQNLQAAQEQSHLTQPARTHHSQFSHQHTQSGAKPFENLDRGDHFYDYDHHTEHLQAQDDEHLDPSHENNDHGEEIEHEDHDHEHEHDAKGGEKHHHQDANKLPLSKTDDRQHQHVQNLDPPSDGGYIQPHPALHQDAQSSSFAGQSWNHFGGQGQEQLGNLLRVSHNQQPGQQHQNTNDPSTCNPQHQKIFVQESLPHDPSRQNQQPVPGYDEGGSSGGFHGQPQQNGLQSHHYQQQDPHGPQSLEHEASGYYQPHAQAQVQNDEQHAQAIFSDPPQQGQQASQHFAQGSSSHGYHVQQQPLPQQESHTDPGLNDFEQEALFELPYTSGSNLEPRRQTEPRQQDNTFPQTQQQHHVDRAGEGGFGQANAEQDSYQAVIHQGFNDQQQKQQQSLHHNHQQQQIYNVQVQDGQLAYNDQQQPQSYDGLKQAAPQYNEQQQGFHGELQHQSQEKYNEPQPRQQVYHNGYNEQSQQRVYNEPQQQDHQQHYLEPPHPGQGQQEGYVGQQQQQQSYHEPQREQQHDYHAQPEQHVHNVQSEGDQYQHESQHPPHHGYCEQQPQSYSAYQQSVSAGDNFQFAEEHNFVVVNEGQYFDTNTQSNHEHNQGSGDQSLP